MKRNILWLLCTLSAVVLMLGYHTSLSSSSAATTEPAVVSGTTSTSRGSTSATTTSGSSGSSSKSTTVTGDVAETQWGPVQVKLTVSGGKITQVAVVQYPNGNGRDQEINSYALPILVKETTSAQSADIDMVSGATVTSDGYLQSLQSALDKASL